MLKKIGRWVAGRTQGSKGVQKYDDFMRRNPWAGIGLDVAGAVGTGMAGKALLGKVGGIKGLFGGGGSAAASGAGNAVNTAATAAKSANLANLFNPSASIDPSMLSRVGGFIKNNQGLISGAAKTGAAIMGQQAERAQYADRIGLERERLELEKEQDRREQERRERVARLLMPLFDRQMQDLNLPRG